jgi:hypothetical protein
MAETLVVQRGHVGTHNMHVEPGDTPTGVWASIVAQNTGLVAGNWQSHLVCSPSSEPMYVYGSHDAHSQVNQWRTYWPKLGSYSRLSFLVDIADDLAGFWEFTVRLWDAGYGSVFYHGTVTAKLEGEGYNTVTLEWSMADSGLSSHINTNMSVELITWPTFFIYGYWGMYVKMFSIYTANCPL